MILAYISDFELRLISIRSEWILGTKTLTETFDLLSKKTKPDTRLCSTRLFMPTANI